MAKMEHQNKLSDNLMGMAVLGLIIYGVYSFFAPNEPAKPYSTEETNEIASQFSLADGFHYELMKKVVSTRMHNPNSFKHIKTNYSINRNEEGYPEFLMVTMVYQGVDDMNMPYEDVVTAKAAIDGTILEIIKK